MVARTVLAASEKDIAASAAHEGECRDRRQNDAVQHQHPGSSAEISGSETEQDQGADDQQQLGKHDERNNGFAGPRCQAFVTTESDYELPTPYRLLRRETRLSHQVDVP